MHERIIIYETYLEQNVNLLIVDDESKIREGLRRHFEFKGFKVFTAANGAEALNALNETYCPIVISDIKMPVMDGLKLLREIRGQYPITKVIMITGQVTLDNIFTCMRLGAETAIYKPFVEMDELDQAVQRSLEAVIRWQKKLSQLLKMKK